MKAQVKHRRGSAQKLAATTSRNFRSFLLVQQFEAGEIGRRIAQARNERGLIQEDLAEMASFSKRSLQDYEGGVTIPYRHLREIGKLLKRSPEWFLYGDDEEVSGQVAERLEAAASELVAEARRIAELLDERLPPAEAESS